MNNETLNNIKNQLEEDYIDFGIHNKKEIELLITMVKTYENWKALKEWANHIPKQIHYIDKATIINKLNELEKEND